MTQYFHQRKLYVFLFALLTVGWLLPVSYTCIANRRIAGLPLYVNNLYRVTHLFTKRAPLWSNYYANIKLIDMESGTESFEGLHLNEFSRMDIYGYATRLQRMLTDSMKDSREGHKVRKAMALYIRDQYEERFCGENQKVAGVQFARVLYRSGTDALASPDGSWEIPRLETIPSDEWIIISEIDFQP